MLANEAVKLVFWGASRNMTQEEMTSLGIVVPV